MTNTTNTNARRAHRTFRHPLTCETTRLRFLPTDGGRTGTVSRPERAGEDVGPHVFVRDVPIEECRAAWRAAQARLLAEGFEVVTTTFPETR